MCEFVWKWMCVCGCEIHGRYCFKIMVTVCFVLMWRIWRDVMWFQLDLSILIRLQVFNLALVAGKLPGTPLPFLLKVSLCLFPAAIIKIVLLSAYTSHTTFNLLAPHRHPARDLFLTILPNLSVTSPLTSYDGISSLSCVNAIQFIICCLTYQCSLCYNVDSYR